MLAEVENQVGAVQLEFQLRKTTGENDHLSASDNPHSCSLINIKSGNILPHLGKIEVKISIYFEKGIYKQWSNKL